MKKSTTNLRILLRELEEGPRLVIPTIMLVSVCLATIVFAILATRPNTSAGRLTRDDNIFMFGFVISILSFVVVMMVPVSG